MSRRDPDQRNVESAGAFAPLLAAIDDLLGVTGPAARFLGVEDKVGLLEAVEVAQLVGGAFMRSLTGRLVVESPADRGTIFFESGRPVDVALDSIEPGVRAAATAAQAESWFFTIASWTEGSFAWTLGAAPTAHRTLPLRHPAALVNEALLRRNSPDRLRRALGPEGNRFRLVRRPGTEAFVDGFLAAAIEEPAVRQAVQLFDGTRSFRAVVEGSRQREELLLRAAFVLLAFGVLRAAHDDDHAGDAEDDAGGLGGAAPLAADRARIAALAALASESDYFTFLGIDREASRAEVAGAVARIAGEIAESRLDPDLALATGRERRLISEVLAEAARLLGDDGLRVRYKKALG